MAESGSQPISFVFLAFDYYSSSSSPSKSAPLPFNFSTFFPFSISNILYFYNSRSFNKLSNF